MTTTHGDREWIGLEEAKVIAWALYWSAGPGQAYSRNLALRLNRFIADLEPEYELPYVYVYWNTCREET